MSVKVTTELATEENFDAERYLRCNPDVAEARGGRRRAAAAPVRVLRSLHRPTVEAISVFLTIALDRHSNVAPILGAAAGSRGNLPRQFRMSLAVSP